MTEEADITQTIHLIMLLKKTLYTFFYYLIV